jgi:hypothetical protein
MTPTPTRKGATPANRDHATYVYAVAAGGEPPELSLAPPGVPGAGEPRALELGEGRWLVVADVPAQEYDAEVLENGLSDINWVSDRAVAHEAMVEHLARHATVVPTKLFTLFNTDERALEHLSAQHDELSEVFGRIEGCQEWGIRVLRSPQPVASFPARPPAATGRDYLERRKADRNREKEEKAAIKDECEGLFTALSAVARSARRRPPLRLETGESLLVDDAFLVERAAADAFERVVRRGATALGALGCEMTLTGPWPAYNFVAPEDSPP